jgi:hypothetical protein
VGFERRRGLVVVDDRLGIVELVEAVFMGRPWG